MRVLSGRSCNCTLHRADCAVGSSQTHILQRKLQRPVGAFRGVLAASLQHRRSTQCQAVDYRIAAPPAKFDHSGTTEEIRTFLTKLGWERAWIDGITERIFKLEFETSVQRTEAVIKFLEGLGIPNHWVCNLAARVPAILGRDPDSQLQKVVDYVKGQGVEGDALLRLLRDYPRLLLFTPEGGSLRFGDARAAVDVSKDPRRGAVATVSYWREGAAFETAPLAPIKPGVQ